MEEFCMLGHGLMFYPANGTLSGQGITKVYLLTFQGRARAAL
jgi:hypothetical protein